VLGATAALAIRVYLVALGQFWAAGKALSMLSPFLFLAIVLPIMTPSPAVVWQRGLI